MNRIFRIIWSTALRTWVVASEFATPHGKGKGKGRSVDKRTNATEALLGRVASEGWGLRLCVLAALVAMYTPAHAVDRYWDPNGTTPGLGGSGTWNTAPGFWSNNGDGTSGPYTTPWSNGALDNAIFGGTVGTVTLGEAITVHNITFGTLGYVVTGNTLTLGGTTPTVTLNAGVDASINSTIAGTAGLTKAGAGGLFLGGTNTFTGGVFVNAGFLNLGGDAALGNASNVLTMAGGTRLGSSAALSASRVVALNSGLVVITGAGVGSARFTGAGGLNPQGSVSLTNSLNDYAGQTRFTALQLVNNVFNVSSVADEGVASAMGAATGANATIVVQSNGNSGTRYSTTPAGPAVPTAIGICSPAASVSCTSGTAAPAR